jgi:2-polyprenyl-6-methoxyphenol hydroxylase-like FAD-dependent oxidoreductase
MDALNAIGACDPVLDASFAATRLRIFHPDGGQAADAPLGRDHPCPRTITRAALSGILRDQALRRGVPVRHGKRLATAATSPDGQVTAVFTDADGFYSPVRTLIDPAAPAPRYTGLAIAFGYADTIPAATSREGYDMYHGRQPGVLRLHRRARRAHLAVRPDPPPSPGRHQSGNH